MLEAVNAERRAAMGYYVGLDVSLKRTAICVLDADGRVVWRGSSDTHPGMIGEALDRWRGSLERVGLETGSTTPWLARGLKALRLPVVVMDARRAAAALKARVMKTDVADARALAEMLRTGWYTEVFVKSEDSHPSDQGGVVSARSAGSEQANIFWSDPGPLASLRDQVGLTAGHKTV
jgi:hypothetical protein